jgi:hypothetical protein
MSFSIRSCSNSTLFDIVSFNDIFAKAEIDIINDLLQMDKLHDLKLNNRDVKSAFYFYTIKHVYDHVTNNKRMSRVYYYSSCDVKSLELIEYANKTRLTNFLTTVFKNLQSTLPITFYMGDLCYDRVVNSDPRHDGDVKDTIEHIKATRKWGSSLRTLHKIKKLIHDKQFYWLEKNCFKDPNHVLGFYK